MTIHPRHHHGRECLYRVQRPKHVDLHTLAWTSQPRLQRTQVLLFRLPHERQSVQPTGARIVGLDQGSQSRLAIHFVLDRRAHAEHA